MLNAVKNFAITFCISLIIFGLIAFIVVQLFLGTSGPDTTTPTESTSQSETVSESAT